MSDEPDFIWAWVSHVFVNDDRTPGSLNQWWASPPINSPSAGTPYVRREPAVLAELPEVKALVGPAPKDGWNVMQVGQVGWHVVQSGTGWKTTPIFGPEILSRDDAGSASGPAHFANLEGGQGAADAPTYTEAEVQALVAAAVMEAAEQCETQSAADQNYANDWPDERAKMEERSWRAHTLSKSIRALITPDAKAALDAYVAGKVREALEKVLRLTDELTYCCDIEDAIRAMIPEAQP